MPFEYSDIEDEVVTRLQTVLTGSNYTVMPLPDKAADYKRLVNTNSALFIVAFSDSQFDGPEAIDIIRQKETVTLLVNIRASKRKGDYSINQGLQIIKLLLLGYQPANCGKMFLKSIEFEERNDEQNYFSYNVTFSAKKLQVQADNLDEIAGPLLQQIFWRINPPE